MSQDRQRQAMSIFLRATELEIPQRSKLLDQECGSDEKLRDEVEALLRHHTTKTLLSTQKQTIVAAPSARSSSIRRKTFFRQASIGIKRRRQALLAAAAMVLIILATAAWAYTKVRASLQSSVDRQLRTVLAAELEALQLWIDLQQADAVAWATDAEVRSIIIQLAKTDEVDKQKQISRSLMQALASVVGREGYQGIAVVNPSGRLIGGSRDWIGGQVNEQGVAYLAVLNSKKAFFAIPSRTRRFVAGIPSNIENPAVAVGAPVCDDQGEVVAGLCFGFDADQEFARVFTVADFDASGDTYAFESNAMLISNLSNTANTRWVQKLKLIEPEQQTALNLSIVDPGGDLTAGHIPKVGFDPRPTKIVELALSSRELGPEHQVTMTDVKGYRNYLGVEVVGAAKWLDDLGFGVATEMSVADAFEPLRYVTAAFIFLIGSVTALALGLLVSALSIIRMRDRIGEAERLGAYELQELIGEGGMGRVYRARHAFLKREAAIKLLDGIEAEQQTIDRFEREVQLTCQLTHPNTIQIYDYGRTDTGVFYYAMEYLPGITLEQLVVLVGSIPPARVIYLLGQVCASLEEAHRSGLIHRDIKPANIMLCDRGGIADFVKVLDFGIAKKIVQDPNREITRNDSIVGTPHYIAPERIAGDTQVDAKSDLYSVGCVGFYLLTASTPFQTKTPAKLFHQVLSQKAPSPSSRAAQPIPPELDELICSCLRQESRERPASAGEIVRILDTLAKQFPWTQDDAHSWWNRQGNEKPLAQSEDTRIEEQGHTR